jgi:RHS repeat-associated protein
MEKDDPLIRENVNVLSGNLELISQDMYVEGAEPLKILRSYSSSGSCERVIKKDLDLKKIDLIPQMESGWNFMPHLQLLVDPRINGSFGLKVHVKEASGEITTYESTKIDGSSTLKLYAQSKPTPIFGVISGFNNPKNSVLEINYKKGRAKLKLANGSYRIYKGKPRNIIDHLADKAVINIERDIRNYLLQEEVSPSGQVTAYEYFEGIGSGIKKILISKKNPTRTKTYCWIQIEKISNCAPFKIKITTSDMREAYYEGLIFRNGEYLNFITNGMNISDEYSYEKLRTSRGASLKSIKSYGKETIRVDYYKPEKSSDGEKWKKKPYKKPYEIDKVKAIYVAGNLKATFSYKEGITEVRDSEGILTKYYFDQNKLYSIEYYRESDQLYSIQKFVWENDKLTAKYVLDKDSNIHLGKLIHYDDFGSITHEILIGNISGDAKDPIIAKKDALPIGGEKYSKKYTYDPETHLLISEREDNGLLTSYTYLDGTNLVKEKTLLNRESVVQTERYEYDEDNLLVAEIVMDGISIVQKNYKRDPSNKKIESIQDNFKKTEYIYNSHNQITSELVSDSSGKELYFIHYEYDRFGRMIAKTNPFGSKNIYTYSNTGNLLSAKEIGSPKIFYNYDSENRVIEAISNGKTSKTRYNSKGWIIEKIDFDGKKTNYEYDAFGRAIKTILPVTLDENGVSYRSVIECEYDIFSNPVFCKNARGEIKKSSFNILRMPTEEIFDDGLSTKTTYTLSGKIKSFTNRDLSETYYEHDCLGRLISKKTGYDSEYFEYNGNKLIKEIDETGLETNYKYNLDGNLIEKKASSRITRFFYNEIGQVEKIVNGPFEKNEKYDAISRLIYEDQNGENQTFYFYDEEGRKNKILKKTSASDAVDIIDYDEEGRIKTYVNPLGHKTKFEYRKNTKTTIDPDENYLIETFDSFDRLIKVENKGKDLKTYACTENFYDRSGNLAKKLTHIYEQDKYIKTHTINWNYDFRGLIIKESSNDKSSTMVYDALGRLIQKTLFNGVILNYEYHPSGLLKRLHSSDETLDYWYEYSNHSSPTNIFNGITKKTLQREYNEFGELISEKTEEGKETKWTYDLAGRKLTVILPDLSKISYEYQNNHMKKVSKVSKDGTITYFHTYDDFDQTGHVKKESFILNLGENKTTRNSLEQIKSITSPYHREEIEYNKNGLVSSVKNTLIDKKAKKFTYDTLLQINTEGKNQYNFNSMGNPSDEEVDDSCQLSQKYLYDENGNPIKCLKTGKKFTFDALSRLIEIKETSGKVTQYTYDAFSRLVKKTTRKNSVFTDILIYVYDQEVDIGAMNLNGKMVEFRLLGLGIEADIGATVAIEIDNVVYLPINDYHGNIVGLISKNGVIVSVYEFDSFGNENSPNCENPWRFSSKRKEDTFYFFGKRFLDPINKRWLTPDPIGYFDSPNCYLFNLNSPKNRIDLFGLYSLDTGFYFEPSKAQKGNFTPNYLKPNQIIFCKGILSDSPNATPVDIVVISGDFHKIKFSPSERLSNVSNLLNHFHEIVPKDSNKIGLVTFQNGINTSFSEFVEHCKLIYNKIPKGTPLIGIHNKSEGLRKDTKRAIKALQTQKPNNNAIQTGLFTGLIADLMGEVQSESFWIHIPHSEAGGLFNLGSVALTEKQKEIMRNQLIVLAIAPSIPIAKDSCYEATNVYSRKDFVTGFNILLYMQKPDYKIKSVKSTSPRSEYSAYITDHAFNGKTYQDQIERKIREIQNFQTQPASSRR